MSEQTSVVLKSIHQLYIFRSDGELMFYRNYKNVEMDPVLATGFFSAIQSFTRNMLHDEVTIKGMDLGKYHFLFSIDSESDLSIVMVLDEKNTESAERAIKRILDFVRTNVDNSGNSSKPKEIYDRIASEIDKLLTASTAKEEKKGQQIQHIASLTEAGKNAKVSLDETKILNLCDGRTSINEIAKNVDLPYFEIMKEILYFKRIGLLTVRKALA